GVGVVVVAVGVGVVAVVASVVGAVVVPAVVIAPVVGARVVPAEVAPAVTPEVEAAAMATATAMARRLDGLGRPEDRSRRDEQRAAERERLAEHSVPPLSCRSVLRAWYPLNDHSSKTADSWSMA